MAEVFVVSIDEDRWRKAEMAASFPIIKIEGFTVDDVTDRDIEPLIEYRIPDMDRRPTEQERIDYRRKKVAIRLSMLKAVVVAQKYGGGTILQDDYTLDEPPVPVTGLVLHNTQNSPSHHCPRAFSVDGDMAGVLAAVWRHDTMNVCGLWEDTVRNTPASYHETARRIGWQS